MINTWSVLHLHSRRLGTSFTNCGRSSTLKLTHEISIMPLAGSEPCFFISKVSWILLVVDCDYWMINKAGRALSCEKCIITTRESRMPPSQPVVLDEQHHHATNHRLKTTIFSPYRPCSHVKRCFYQLTSFLDSQSLLGTYLYVPVEVSEDYPGEKHTKPQNVKVSFRFVFARIIT